MQYSGNYKWRPEIRCGKEFSLLIQARSAISVTAKSVRNSCSQMLQIHNLINSFAKPICTHTHLTPSQNSHQIGIGKSTYHVILTSFCHSDPWDWETITAIFHDNHSSALPSLRQAEAQQAWLIWPICSADYAVYRTLNLSQLAFLLQKKCLVYLLLISLNSAQRLDLPFHLSLFLCWGIASITLAMTSIKRLL